MHKMQKILIERSCKNSKKDNDKNQFEMIHDYPTALKATRIHVYSCFYQ